MTTAEETTAPPRNAVSLAGRVSSTPIERELPSGDRVVTFRLVVAREQSPMTAKSKQVSDWVDCAAWGGRVRRSVASWQVDDRVEIEGPCGAGSSGTAAVPRPVWRSRCSPPGAWGVLREGEPGQASRRSLRTSPMRGFGLNEVDFRGSRTPLAALAITCSRRGGRTPTTTPGSRAVVWSAWSSEWW